DVQPRGYPRGAYGRLEVTRHLSRPILIGRSPRSRAVRSHLSPRPVHAGARREAARDAAGDAPLSQAAPSAGDRGQWSNARRKVLRSASCYSAAAANVLAGALPAAASARAPGGVQALVSGR